MRLPFPSVAGLTFLLAAPFSAAGQATQNPSPMVEHTRSHLRLKEEKPSGRREPLEIGTLFLPANLRLQGKVPLLVHFHGSTWLPEAAARDGKTAVLTVQLGSGSSAYARPFADPKRFAELLKRAEEKAGVQFDPVTLSAWSAGYGAVREILKVPEYYQRVRGVLEILRSE
jgi:hypothetical protein